MKTVYYEITTPEMSGAVWTIFEFKNIDKFLSGMFMHPIVNLNSCPKSFTITRKICKSKEEFDLLKKKDAEL